MKNRVCLVWIIAISGFLFPSFSQAEGAPLAPTLRQQAEQRNFRIGGTKNSAPAINADPLYTETLAREFNILTQEGPTYFNRLHTNPPASLLSQLDPTSCDSMFFDRAGGLLPEYNFDPAFRQMEFAGSNGIHVRNHTLIWHEALPEWLFVRKRSATGTGCERVKDAAGNLIPRFSPEVNRTFLVEHIKNVMQQFRTRFPDTLTTWDVVNEAIDATPSNPNGRTPYEKWFRDTLWSRIGATPDEFIKLAFTTAHEADPRARLFYNENGYPWEQGTSTKFEAMLTLMRTLRAEQVPIHGIGFQMHLRLDEAVDYQGLLTNMLRLKELGLEVQITELDVKIPLQDWNRDGKKDAADEALVPSTLLERQATQYRNVLRTCLRAGNCTALLSWGFTDKYSWITSKNHEFGSALPFDRQYNKKPAYQGLMDALVEAYPRTAPTSIEAVGVMQHKDRGVPTPDGQSWKMAWNGGITETICFPDQPVQDLKPYRIEVKAKGTPAGGIWPLLEFHLMNRKIKAVSVDSGEWKHYGLTLQVTPGCYPLTLKYVNDALVGTEDRDLTIDRIAIFAVQPDDPAGDRWGLYNTSHEFMQAACVAGPAASPVPYRFEVQAKGSPGAGIWPVMDLLLNGQKMKSVPVLSETPEWYGLTAHLQPGCYAFSARLINDYFKPPEDRNIWISKAAFKTLLPNDPGGDNWNLYRNGEIHQGLCVNSPLNTRVLQSHRIKVGARGSPAAGVWPLMEIRLNGKTTRTHSVVSATEQPFGATAQLQSGCYALSLRFINDLDRPPEDRNLWIHSVEVKPITTVDPAGDIWTLYKNNEEVAQAVCVSASRAPYLFDIQARGSRAAGIWPILSLVLNGVAVSQTSVASETASSYSPVAELTAGCHTVVYRFTNDLFRPPEDRNIWITGLRTRAR